MDICVDFDGTCVTHEFPKVGKDIGAVPVLKKLVAKGHRLILFTMRSNCENNTGASACVPEVHNGNFLDDAVNWFKENDIPLYGIQTNPTQYEWTSSPKAYGQLYIDDAALGCPLRWDIITHPDGHYAGPPVMDGRPYVDWKGVEALLIAKGIL